MRILLVHFGDLHCTETGTPFATKLKVAASALMAHCPQPDHLHLCFDGDVSDTGKKREFTAASRVITDFAREFSCPITEHYTPGNHDLDLQQDEERADLRDLIRKDPHAFTQHESLLDPILRCLDEFFNFENGRTNKKRKSGAGRLIDKQEFPADNYSICITTLNTAWLSQRHEQAGTLVPGPLQGLPKPDERTFHVLMCHHPIGWLAPEFQRPLRDYCKDHVSLLMCSHEHQCDSTLLSASNSSFLISDGGALAKNGTEESSFSFFLIDTTTGSLSTFRAKYGSGVFQITEQTPIDLRTLVKSGRSIRLLDSYRQTIDKHPLPVRHPKQDGATKLTDLYVWPSLERQARRVSATEPPEGFSADKVLTDADVDVAVIWGGEKSGKTSLLRRLSLLADERDFLPLYVDRLKFDQKHQSDLMNLVKRCVEEQYGQNTFDAFSQSSTPRYLLIDDVEFSSHHIELMQAGIRSVQHLFSKVILGIPSTTFIQSALTAESFLGPSAKASVFRIRELNAAQKRSMVEMWTHLGGKEHHLEEPRDVDDIFEALVDALRLSHLPHFPIFALTLLSAVGNEAQPDSFKLATYGFHFHIIVSAAIDRVARALKLSGGHTASVSSTEVLLARLAQGFNERTEVELSEGECRSLLAKVIKEHGFPISSAKFIEACLSEDVLAQVEGSIRFRYPLVRHYFIAKHLVGQLDREATAISAVSAFRTLLGSLDKRASMNIALILFYLAPREVLQRGLADALTAEASASTKEIEDVLKGITSLVELDRPLLDSSESPGDTRRKAIVAKDKTADAPEAHGRHSDLDDRLEATNSFFMDYNRRRGLVQLTGQLLRAATGSFFADEKRAFISKTIGMLIGQLEALVEFFNENRNIIVGQMNRGGSGAVEDHKLIEALDQYLGVVSFCAALDEVLLIAESLSHPELRDVLAEMYQRESKATERLALFAVELSSRKKVDNVKLKEFKKAWSKSSPTTWHLLRFLVYRHLRLYGVEPKARVEILATINASADKTTLMKPLER